MANVRDESDGQLTRVLLDGRALANGDEIEVRLGGDQGWTTATIDGLPHGLRIVFKADDGARLVTTLPPDTTIRWPE